MEKTTTVVERTRERLYAHYQVEQELANRIRGAAREERKQLYSTVYDELFQRVQDHPQVTRKADPAAQMETVRRHLRLLDRYLQPTMTFMEVGSGDCSLSIAVSKTVRHVFAVDVSAEITKAITLPANVELIIADGSRIPVPDGSVDVAYSHQLIEHLHPDDAEEHVRSVYRALAPGGVYVCITPNRLNGPHDISKFFDPVATGFHMKEYTASELMTLFTSTGFRSATPIVGVKGRYRGVLPACVRSVERTLDCLPHSACLSIAKTRITSAILGITIVARK